MIKNKSSRKMTTRKKLGQKKLKTWLKISQAQCSTFKKEVWDSSKLVKEIKLLRIFSGPTTLMKSFGNRKQRVSISKPAS
jgi:hypothetical protein